MFVYPIRMEHLLVQDIRLPKQFPSVRIMMMRMRMMIMVILMLMMIKRFLMMMIILTMMMILMMMIMIYADVAQSRILVLNSITFL